MRRLAHAILRLLAREVLQRYRPQVIGITGSYGKTSAKEAIAAVLSTAYAVRASRQSYNNEFGVPFTILDVIPGRSGVETFFRALKRAGRLLLGRQPYPTLLVIEMGADRPGDIAEILGYVPVDVGVVTSVGPTHLQRFGNVDNVYAEKSLLASHLRDDGWAVLNADDHRVRGLGEVATTRIVSYGYQDGVAVRCLDAAIGRDQQSGEWGVVVKLAYAQEELRVFIPGVAGQHSVYAALAAAAVGLIYRLDTVEIIDGLRRYQPPPGRMRILSGANGTVLLDDTYNASPDSTVAAIEALRQFPTEGRRIAVLGDMVDLGASSAAAHHRIGEVVVENEIDFLVAVGPAMVGAAAGARANGWPPERILTVEGPEAAALAVQANGRRGDVVLLKGSQVSRMEKTVKLLLADPSSAHQLLVRQYGKWLRA